jgi:ferritin
MTSAQFVEFLNKTQRDPRLNEILYPYANTSRAKDLIQQYEPNKYNAQRGINFCDCCKSVCHYHFMNFKSKLTLIV